MAFLSEVFLKLLPRGWLLLPGYRLFIEAEETDSAAFNGLMELVRAQVVQRPGAAITFGRRSRLFSISEISSHHSFRMKIPFLLGAALLAAGPALAQAVNTGPAYDARTLFNPSFIEQLATPTRTAGGQPGAQYWQNAADYKIDARLDENTARVTATATITYTNNSPDRAALRVAAGRPEPVSGRLARGGRDARGRRALRQRGRGASGAATRCRP